MVSTEINDLNDKCLKEIFMHFSLLDWAITIRVVCTRWYRVIGLLWLELLNRSNDEQFNEEPDANKIAIEFRGNYFFKRIHFLRITQMDYNEIDRNEGFSMYIKKNDTELHFFEDTISSFLKHYFDTNMQYYVFNVAYFVDLSSQRPTVERPITNLIQLLTITMFGYVEGPDADFSQKISYLFEYVQARTNVQHNPDAASAVKLKLIDSPDREPFRSLICTSECYSLSYTANNLDCFLSQMSPLISRMQPERLSKKRFHDYAASFIGDKWNGMFKAKVRQTQSDPEGTLKDYLLKSPQRAKALTYYGDYQKLMCPGTLDPLYLFFVLSRFPQITDLE